MFLHFTTKLQSRKWDCPESNRRLFVPRNVNLSSIQQESCRQESNLHYFHTKEVSSPLDDYSKNYGEPRTGVEPAIPALQERCFANLGTGAWSEVYLKSPSNTSFGGNTTIRLDPMTEIKCWDVPLLFCFPCRSPLGTTMER